MSALRCTAAVLEAAINQFHQSIGHNGPYPGGSLHKCVTVSEAVFQQTEAHFCNLTEICLFICDSEAFSRMEEAFASIPLLSSGSTVPHVNMCAESIRTEWFLISTQSWGSVDSSETSCHYTW